MSAADLVLRVFHEGAESELLLPADGMRLTFGASGDCDLRLSGPVAAVRATVIRDRERVLLIHDGGPPFTVNGNMIRPPAELVLLGGDRIDIGSYRIEVVPSAADADAAQSTRVHGPLTMMKQRLALTVMDQPRLTPLDRTDASGEIMLRTPGDIIVIGRAPDCDLVLRHPSVSKHHAKLHWDIVGVALYDLGSTNGTRRNGSRLTESEYLRDGDEVSAGAVRLRFTWRGQDAIPHPSPRQHGTPLQAVTPLATADDTPEQVSCITPPAHTTPPVVPSAALVQPAAPMPRWLFYLILAMGGIVLCGVIAGILVLLAGDALLR
ncbi:FHA domain-containing protein [bacterium]|nr:FHA domain-containing protein [candidate division CSSED10-310 bacterium]